MSSKCAAPTLPILRGSLRSYPANGHMSFVPQIRKLVFEYCDYWPSSAHTRTFLRKHVEQLARDNSHVEIIVKQRNYKQPIVRGFYMNGREKVVPLNGFEMTMVQQKVQLLLDASGSQIKPLKNRTVESFTESPRGIWSGLHVELFKI
ncbi:thioredoxin-like protein [Gautieria morchelliformis]|nr:thioredoxin-like protein [Gautieria morchelliformis]